MHTQAPRATQPEFDTRHFRHALSQFATGVTIITIKRYEKGTYPIPKLLVLYTEAN